jgi:potassium intermediate/small conductance calcium-activated channel subfamily N protein 2
VPALLAQVSNQSQGGSQKSGSNDISNFSNALWLTIITMTTVGYGDYYPRTTFGRVIDVFLVVWGTFIVSLMVVVLTNTLNMDQSEKRALIVLNRLEAKKALKEAAALLITHTCKKYLLKKSVKSKKRSALTKEEESRLENTFYKYLTNFQSVHRAIRSMYEIDDVYEEMTRQFEFINDEISFLLGSQKETIDNLQLYLHGNRNDNKSAVS